ncbi:hypothetical protein JOC54_000706 [Alkalihalobacillus xiaoxiensis]|uniref:Uncharacterized protein n=1 Tax=Shouchella xiaoxiensis TaxID=766895 RepID=A0ABS2SPP1_9BACI|nr:hypothetical protein [Shouchella xiaoxiensis]MBM7837475.1 hypothetical protein [Shouchella xiaoxiensis]
MTQAEKKQIENIQKQIKMLSEEIDFIKQKHEMEFEQLETDSSLVQTYN